MAAQVRPRLTVLPLGFPEAMKNWGARWKDKLNWNSYRTRQGTTLRERGGKGPTKALAPGPRGAGLGWACPLCEPRVPHRRPSQGLWASLGKNRAIWAGGMRGGRGRGMRVCWRGQGWGRASPGPGPSPRSGLCSRRPPW